MNHTLRYNSDLMVFIIREDYCLIIVGVFFLLLLLFLKHTVRSDVVTLSLIFLYCIILYRYK